MVVIGGGINGVAIARECARGGLRTLLAEKHDFASGTTSRSTRIIHGGLRYLEHGEIGLVRESLRERQRLLTERPHLVRPLHFVLAMPTVRRSALALRLGLWLYRQLGRATPPLAGDVRAFERTLDARRDSLRLFHYDDAQCEFPERLVAEWLREAISAGAIARNHTSAVAVRTADRRVRSVVLRDEFAEKEYEVSTRHIVNAAGPWVDTVCAASDVATSGRLIGGVRGSHIVLARFPGAPQCAVYTEAPDGRPVFLVPWNGQLLFGTTEVRDDSDPGQSRPSEAEISYLMHSLRQLWPDAHGSEISFAMAGVRPLPREEGKRASAISRRHFLHDHSDDGAHGMISVIGGKLTTAASLARECARKLSLIVPEPASQPGFVETPDVDASLERFAGNVALIAGVDHELARTLVDWHGGEAIAVAHTLAAAPSHRNPICVGQQHMIGEAVFAVDQEAAVTLADILLRRVPIALTPGWTRAQTRESARNIGAALGWGERMVQCEIENFEQERSAFLVQPSAVRIAA